MELNEINSANMTDRIAESISRTNDGSIHEENSALNEHIQREDREESEEIYEEYKFEGDYEEYRFRYQEYGQERESANTRNNRSIDETLFQKLLKIKWWLICMILVLVIVGTVVGLSIHFIKPITTEPITTEPITTEPIMTEPITTEPITIEPTTRKGPALKEAVLILSTYKGSNVPMVITLTGESKQVSALPVSFGLARHSVTLKESYS